MELIIILIVIGLLGILYLVFENKNLAVSEYFIEQERVPEAFDGMRFVCVTDLHNNSFGKKNSTLIKKIHSLKPDAILISGDMIISKHRKKNFVSLELLQELTKHYPVYYSPGNHESKWKEWEKNHPDCNRLDSYEAYIADIKEAGVIYLDNKNIVLQKKNQTMQITGLTLPLSFFERDRRPEHLSNKDITDLIGTANCRDYQILLAHMPIYFESYALWGADFVLAGHVHGGIMRIPFVGGVISPQYEIFPKYDAGAFSFKNSIMLISRGLGTHTIPVRVFNRPELICIELKKK